MGQRLRVRLVAACVAFIAILASEARPQVSKRDLPRVYAVVKQAAADGAPLADAVQRLRAKGLVADTPQGLFNLGKARGYDAELRKLDLDRPASELPHGLAPGGLGGGAGEQEPNDDFGSASPLACGVPADGAIATDADVDFWVFTVAERTGVTAAVDAAASSSLDTLVKLYDASGTELGNDDDSGPGTDSRLDSVVPAGTYFVEVLPAFPGSTGDYRLTLSCATEIGHVGCRELVPIDFDQDGQVFLFSVDAPERADLELRVHSFASPVDPSITLVDEHGAIVARDDDGGPGTDARLQVTLAPGRYHAIADTFDGVGRGNAYFQSICSPTAGVTLDEREPDDDLAHATPAACCDVAGGEIATASDADLFRLDLLAPTRLVLATATPDSDLDTVVVLLDAQGRELARDDDSGPITDSLLGVDLEPGTYYAEVLGFQSTGGYQLAVVCDALLPIAATETAPNDQRDLANPIDSGTAVTGAIAVETDVDYWRLSVLTPGDVTIAVDTPESTLDPRLTIENSAGDRLFFDDDGGPDQDARLDVFLVRGTYFLKVAGFDSTGSYDLSIRGPLMRTGSLVAGEETTIWWRGRNADRFFCLVGMTPGDVETRYGVQLIDPATFVLRTTIGPCGIEPSTVTIPGDLGGQTFLVQALVGNELWDGAQFSNRLAVDIVPR